MIGIHPLHSQARTASKQQDTLAWRCISINDGKRGFHRQCDSASHFKDELAEVFIMDRQCPALCERSGSWEQKQLTLLVPLGTVWDRGSLQLSYLPTADWEQVNTILWINRASHVALSLTEKIRQLSLLETKRLSNSLQPAHLSWFFPNLLPKCLDSSLLERVAKLPKTSVRWVVLGLVSWRTGYQDWEAFAKTDYMDWLP